MCIFGALWSSLEHCLQDGLQRALEHGASLTTKSAALGLYPPLEGIQLRVVGCLRFCLVILLVCVWKDDLFYMGYNSL